ncbi:MULTISPECIES: hypothetical protein [Yersinia]|uniref:hypothetical protein n=1 Tax=Yersinia TaxID=629 RepID=UPI001866F221|nr:MULTISPECIES: hypothetical protein [Yersinia]
MSPSDVGQLREKTNRRHSAEQQEAAAATNVVQLKRRDLRGFTPAKAEVSDH